MSSLYTNIASGLLFPLHEKLKGHDSYKVLREMERVQWWEPSKLEGFRLQRLQAMLEYVSKYVPYYRELFQKAGFSHNKCKSLSDISQIPLLTKADIRENFDALKSSKSKRLSRFSTGGSSGEPLIFLIGKERVSHDVAAKWRATRWWDVDIGDPEIVIWGSPIEVGSQDRIKAIRDRIFRTRLLPAFEMSEQKLNEFIREIRSYRPKMLFGYPSALAHIAKHARKHNVIMNEFGIKVAFVTSERLYDHQRQIIQEVFGCPVANGYGGRDAGFIAHECPKGGMHITAEDIIVEIVDREGKVLPVGQEGEVVITHLATADYPFIRYRTGDVAVLDDQLCKCGRGLPLIKEIQGRTTDFIVAKNGTVMHGLALIYVIRDVEGVQNSKITQDSIDSLRVQLVTDEQFQESSLELIRLDIKQRLGESVVVEIEQVKEIPLEASGKFRYVVSHVSV